MTAPAKSGTRLDYIDGLRGIAAAAVMAQHIAEIVAHTRAAPASVVAAIDLVLVNGLNLGRFGVALFFLVSGFVVPFGFRRPAPVRRFVLSRVARLYPAYWLSLLVALGAMAATGAALPPAATVVANLTMVQHALGRPDVVASYWTLLIEIIFYALCAALFVAGRLRTTGVVLAAAASFLAAALLLAVASAALGRHLPTTIPVSLALMFTGMLARLGWYEGRDGARRAAWAMAAALLLAIPIIYLSVAPSPDGTADVVVPSALVAGYYAALLTFALALRMRPAFGRAVLWLGTASYSIYLFHGPMLILFRPLLRQGDTISGIAFATIVAATTLGLSGLVWRLLEQPCIAYGRAIAARLDRETAGARTAASASETGRP